jgi:hypothetical protein
MDRTDLGVGRDLSGRPFPPEAAEARFSELKAETAVFIRFSLPWKAVEPGGPGEYDEDYLAYLRKIFLAAGKQGLKIVVDSAETAAPGLSADPAGQEQFLAALRHAYRRLKTCKAITAWTIPGALGEEFRRRFTDTMREVNPALEVPGALKR